MSQSSKKILVVGGRTGIGAELVAQLQQQGHEVIVTSREVFAPANPAGVTVQQFDATDPDATLDLPDTLDGIVYAPGTIVLKPFQALKTTDFQGDLEVNFLGAVRVLQQALPALKKSESAAVVLFSTVAVGTGLRFHASIASAKGAVEGLTRSLAAEWAPRIRVNAIAPSLTDTPLAFVLLSNGDRREASAQRHPLQRIGEPAEVAAMAAFLLGDQARGITGQVLQVDNGMSALRPI